MERYCFEYEAVEEFDDIGSDVHGAFWPEFKNRYVWAIYDRKSERLGEVNTAALAQQIVDMLNARERS